MDKAHFQNLCLDLIRTEGFKPDLDSEGDNIRFKMEGKTFCLMIDGDDLQFIHIVLPNIWSIEDPLERQRALAASERATAKTKVAKVYLVHDNVWVSFEMLLPSPDSLKPVFLRALRTLVVAARNFADHMKESMPRKGFVGIA